MRIWYRISGSRAGGAEAMTGALAASARAAGHDVALSAPPEPALDAWLGGLEDSGIAVEREAEVTSKWDLGGLWRARRSMAAANADVLHLQLVHPVADRYLPLLAPRGAALLATEHVRHEVPEPRLLWLKRTGAKRVQKFVAVSTAVRRSLVSHYGIPEGRVRIIRNGVDTARFHPGGERADARRALGLPALGYVVGSAGRLTPQKGFDLLLRSCARVEGAWMLAIAGEGEDGPALRALAEELGIAARVCWLGAVADMPRFYAALDVFALASRWEGLPLTLLEALASGLPAVASAVDGTIDVLAQGGGMLVPPESPEPMARVLDVWRQSEPLRHQAAKDAVRVAALHDWNVTWESYAALYEEVTAWKSAISRRSS